MRRRAVLGEAACLVGTCLAGCTSLRPPGGARHPFDSATVAVTVDDQSGSPHDVVDLADRALAYWNEWSEAYAGFPVQLERRTDRDADLVIQYVDRPDPCHRVENYDEGVLGCAPLLQPGHVVARPARAIVVAAERPPGKITITTQHELGHILGLGHEDEPLEIMSNRPELRIPRYEERMAIWDQVMAADGHASRGFVATEAGSSHWRAETYDSARAAYASATDAFEAAIDDLDAARGGIDAFATDERVETVDRDRLRSALDRLRERLWYVSAFTDAMVAASAAADAGDWTSAQARVDEANPQIRAFNDREAVPYREIAIALGLVRDFERAEPVLANELHEPSA